MANIRDLNPEGLANANTSPNPHVAVYMTDAHNNIITTSGPVYNKVPGAVDVPSWSKHPTQPSPVLDNA